jgi:hypothetical protein
MRNDKYLYRDFAGLARPVRRKGFANLKNRLVVSTRFEELEYIYSSVGRCLSVRSRGKMTSFHIRNIRYGVEQRLFVANPRIIFEYFLNRIVIELRRRGWDSNPRACLRCRFSKSVP